MKEELTKQELKSAIKVANDLLREIKQKNWDKPWWHFWYSYDCDQIEKFIWMCEQAIIDGHYQKEVSSEPT